MLPAPAMNQSKRQLSRYGWRPADPARRPVLFVNPRSGDGKAARAGLAERARERGIGIYRLKATVLSHALDGFKIVRLTCGIRLAGVGMW